MTRSLLAVLLIAALAASAGAYDLLYSGDTAPTGDARTFGIRGSYVHLTADSEFDDEGEPVDWNTDFSYSGKWFVLDLYYVALEGLELGATPLFMMEDREYGPTTPNFTGTGIGDTWVWAKYNFSPDPLLTARAGVKIPTGNDEVLPGEDELELGTGQPDIDGSLMIGLPAGKGSLDISVGYRYRIAKTVEENNVSFEDKPGDEIHFYAGYTHFVGDFLGIRVGADGYFGAQPTRDGNPKPINMNEDEPASSIVFFSPGIDYLAGNGWTLGLDLHFPLMGSNAEAPKGLGLSVGFGS